MTTSYQEKIIYNNYYLYNSLYIVISTQVVYPGRGCSKKCTCLDDGQMKCDAFTCSANEKCDVSEGVATCVPKSRGSCSVGGARTVTSFDGQVKDRGTYFKVIQNDFYLHK